MKNKKILIITLIILIIGGLFIYKMYSDSHLSSNKYTEIKTNMADIVYDYNKYDSETYLGNKPSEYLLLKATISLFYDRYYDFSNSEKNKIKKYYAKTYDRDTSKRIAEIAANYFEENKVIYISYQKDIDNFNDFSSLDVVN